ncbi:MAG TPA: sugar phosphate isomerase/epimerase family protein [Chloroflexota bacterium]|nr:sugar phosphate isomerase/epimerase family protein [Chloroflexota bacterium]
MNAAIAGMTIVFPTLPLEDNLALHAELGFQAVEVWKPHLGTRLGPRMLGAVARQAQAADLTLSALNAIGEPYFDPFRDEQSFAATVHGLKADLALCAHTGMRTLAVWEGRPRPDRDRAWHLEILVRLFTGALEEAQALGVERILFEPHPFTVGFTLGGIPELCQRVGSDHFGIILDTCHLSVAYPRDYLDRMADLVPFAKHLHLGDSDLTTSELHYPPGVGLVDLPACMRVLRAGGFAGSVAWDLYSWPFPKQAIRRYEPVLADLVDQLSVPAPEGSP